MANVQDGHLNLAKVKTIWVERDQIDRYRLKRGDVLMTEGGDFDKLGRGDVWREQIPLCLHQNHVFVVRPDQNRLDSGFLAAMAASEYGRNYFLSCAKRSTNLASINATQLKAFPVLLPCLEEQRGIAAALATWDAAIATTERLLANSLEQKQGLLGRLLIHDRQANTKQRGWSFVDFDEVFERVSRKNTEGNTNVLTISGALGLVNQRDYFKKSVSSVDLTGYTLLRQGEFAYNKSYSANYPMGAIKPLTRYASGVVSSLYLCFRFREGIAVDADFFRHYFDAGMLDDCLAGIAQEGARNHGLLNVPIGDFFKLRLHIPDVDTQRRIAVALNMTEREQHLIRTQIARLRTEKSALMQQLLTGKRRVRLPASPEAASA
ncbi:hypothetical protein RHOFW510R12_04865 [Rhodanobacter sp. FW510-R12]|nr:hypothetical protein RHOFW104R8_05040 [Rhodanobacter sp. FW104-R8]KZC27329.1 hypothetical protein RhoFW510T8_16700 [Rhodanobacter sp. FW510-T8]KZC30166.1 hypothetical protein RhoFW510R10_03025 [Rhodanobacter sp. FW510-R10]